MVIEFLNDKARINGKSYKEGDAPLSVSSSIAKRLLGEGSAKEFTLKKKKNKKREE